MNPEELQFAKTHEWLHLSKDEEGATIATVGISAWAVEALTDLVHVELPEVGKQVEAGESLGEIESVKAVSDFYAPVSGEVIAVNESLSEAAEILGEDPYKKGWIAKIRVSGEVATGDFLDHAAYQKQCDEEE